MCSVRLFAAGQILHAFGRARIFDFRRIYVVEGPARPRSLRRRRAGSHPRFHRVLYRCVPTIALRDLELTWFRLAGLSQQCTCEDDESTDGPTRTEAADPRNDTVDDESCRACRLHLQLLNDFASAQNQDGMVEGMQPQFFTAPLFTDGRITRRSSHRRIFARSPANGEQHRRVRYRDVGR